MRYDIATLKSRLGAIKTDDNPAILKQKSRDFYWYSPTLKRQLDAVVGDIMVTPKTEDELIHVLATCHSLGIPVTPRGTGTGNYGQAMPLSGGVLLDLSAMNAVKSIGHGRVVTEPGAILAEIDHETRRKAGRSCASRPRPTTPPRSAGSSLAARAAWAPSAGAASGLRQHHPPEGRDDGGQPARARTHGR